MLGIQRMCGPSSHTCSRGRSVALGAAISAGQHHCVAIYNPGFIKYFQGNRPINRASKKDADTLSHDLLPGGFEFSGQWSMEASAPDNNIVFERPNAFPERINLQRSGDMNVHNDS